MSEIIVSELCRNEKNVLWRGDKYKTINVKRGLMATEESIAII